MGVENLSKKESCSESLGRGVYIFGAGDLGKVTENELKNGGGEIKGFIDTYKKGCFICDDNRKYDIFPNNNDTFNLIKNENAVVVLAISEYNDYKTVRDELVKKGVALYSKDEVLEMKSNTKSFTEVERKYIADYHETNMEGYYEAAESALSFFWSKESLFRKRFDLLDLENVVELACGHGRHVPEYVNKAKHITLVDILQKNIDFCKNRFKNIDNISYYVNNGYDLSELKSDSYTSLFTYDSMVHFELLDIFSYLKETFRILKNGGMALFHHSNNTSDYKVSFSNGIEGRNYMSKDLFAYLVHRAGLIVMDQELTWYNNGTYIDCLTLVKKQVM